MHFNNNTYRIDPNVRYGSVWPFYDQNNNTVMSFISDYDETMIEKKNMFSNKTILKKRFIYHEKISINNRSFKVYTVNLGINGHHYVFKEENKTVAIIHVNDKQEFYSHEMDLYMENNNTVILMTFLYCFAVNMYQYFHTDETLIHGDSFGVNIWSKSKPYILEKFDSEFIERIKEQERTNF